MERKKILVTGRGGQLGSEIQVISITCPDFDFIFKSSQELDITNQQELSHQLNELQPDFIINCAAYTKVDLAEDDLDQAFAVNANSLLGMIQYCQSRNCKLIHISTDYVFDGTSKMEYRETDSTNPINVYGASKRKGEELILGAKIDAVIIRTSWVYSSFGNNFVKTMLRLGSERESLNVVADQFGSPTYARDLADCCISIVRKSEIWNKGTQIFHYSNGGTTYWAEFASEIMRLANLSCKIVPIPTSDFPTKAKRPSFSVMNKDKISNSFGIEIKDWKDSLSCCIAELK